MLLVDHVPAILSSTAMFTLVYYLSKAQGSQWAAHVVSLVHALLIVPLSVPLLFDQTLTSNPFWGYSFYAGQVYSVAVGYFLWDTVYSIANIKESGIGMVIHGISCLILYLGSFYPFLQYFGSIFLLFEASTIFLNLMWFAQATKSKYYSVFAILFLVSFFAVRIIFAYTNWSSVYHLCWIYVLGCVILNSLNIYWFLKIIKKARRALKF